MGSEIRRTVKLGEGAGDANALPALPRTRLTLRGRLALLLPPVRANIRRAVQRGDDTRDSRDWPAVARAYAEGLRGDPRLDHIWVQLGHALKEAGDPQAAEGAYRAALHYRSDLADTHLNLGHALKLQGRRQEAASAYMRALELEGGWADATRELSGLARDGETLDVGALASALETAPQERPQIVLHLTGLMRAMVAGPLSAGDKARAALVVDLLRGSPDIALCESSSRAAGLRLLAAPLMIDAFSLALAERADEERLLDLRRLLELASGAGSPCVFREGAVLIDFGDAGEGQGDYALQASAAAVQELAYLSALTEDREALLALARRAPAVLVDSVHERRLLLALAAGYGAPLAADRLHVLDEQAGADRPERLLTLAARLSGQPVVRAQAPLAHGGVYYGLGRADPADLVGPEGEGFRSGPGWWSPEPWGCWTRPEGAQLRLALDAQSGPSELFLGLRGLPDRSCPFTLSIDGAPVASGVLSPGQILWRAFPVSPVAGQVVIDVVGAAEQRLEPGARLASVGVIGFTLRAAAAERAA
jgi:tetratricopeptide (TPR) repeat protein